MAAIAPAPGVKSVIAIVTLPPGQAKLSFFISFILPNRPAAAASIRPGKFEHKCCAGERHLVEATQCCKPNYRGSTGFPSTGETFVWVRPQGAEGCNRDLSDGIVYLSWCAATQIPPLRWRAEKSSSMTYGRLRLRSPGSTSASMRSKRCTASVAGVSDVQASCWGSDAASLMRGQSVNNAMAIPLCIGVANGERPIADRDISPLVAAGAGFGDRIFHFNIDGRLGRARAVPNGAIVSRSGRGPLWSAQTFSGDRLRHPPA